MWSTAFLLLAFFGAISAYDPDQLIIGRSMQQDDVDPETTIPDLKGYISKRLDEAMEVLATRNVTAIENLFFSRFIFGGCKANYKRSTFAQMAANVSASIPITLRIISCNWRPKTGHIECMIDTPKEIFGYNNDVQFLYCPHMNTWWSGNYPYCSDSSLPVEDIPDQEYFVKEHDPVIGRSPMKIPDDSNEVVRKFLGSLKTAIDSKDSQQIEKLFGERFVFKGCQGTYNRAEAVQKLISFPADTPIDFTLLSSKWIIHGQIEYTVSISLPIIDDIEAKFVYCPYSKVLKSGSIPKCEKKTRKFY